MSVHSTLRRVRRLAGAEPSRLQDRPSTRRRDSRWNSATEEDLREVIIPLVSEERKIPSALNTSILGALFLEEDFGVRGIVDSPHLNRFLRDTRIPLRGMVDWIVVLSFVDAKHDLSRSRAGLHCRRQLRADVQ